MIKQWILGFPWLKAWTRPTAWLHAVMALLVTNQLLLSLFMKGPRPDQPFGIAQAFFVAHKWLGVVAFGVVVLHWLWLLISRDPHHFKHLFPWCREGFQQIKADLKGLFQKRLPESGAKLGLPGFVHGLGFLAVTAMATTGTLMFFFYPGEGIVRDIVHFSHETHELVALAVWTYWWGHVFMAFLHSWVNPSR